MTPAGEAHAAMRAFPVLPLPRMLDLGPFLVLAPHADDESLGCGGLIAAAVAGGQPPMVIVVTDGAGSHPHSRSHPPARLVALRQDEARAAVAALGLTPDRLAFLGYPDTNSPLDGPALAAAAAQVAAWVVRSGARAIVAPWEHDPHCDHLSAHRMAALAAAATGARHFAYPVWGWTVPATQELPGCPTGYRIDVSAHLAAKRRAIAAHRSQYGGLIQDDPTGFQLSREMLALFDGPFETFIAVPGTCPAVTPHS